MGALTFRELDADEGPGLAAWAKLWRAWPSPDVMAHPAYASLFARGCDRTVCLVGEGEGGVILFPLLIRPLAAEPWARQGEQRWDATTPYGYGGPFAWGPAPPFEAFWGGYRTWCAERQVVTTFARLSLFPEQLAQMPGTVGPIAPNIVVPLGAGPDALWLGHDSKVRRWVRRAERSGVEIELDRRGDRLDDFVEVYAHTMQRTGADPWYRFPRQFFEGILARLAGHFVFFHALVGGRVVSSDLVLHAGAHAYYFLGGTLKESFSLGPNYLLKHRMACWADSAGLGALVLGGGHLPSDGLFHYKRSFARHGEVPFQVATLVHDEPACAELVRDRASHAERGGEPWAPRPKFFPPYRA